MDLIYHKGYEVSRIDVVGKTKNKVVDKEGLESKLRSLLACGERHSFQGLTREQKSSLASLAIKSIP